MCLCKPNFLSPGDLAPALLHSSLNSFFLLGSPSPPAHVPFCSSSLPAASPSLSHSLCTAYTHAHSVLLSEFIVCLLLVSEGSGIHSPFSFLLVSYPWTHRQKISLPVSVTCLHQILKGYTHSLKFRSRRFS